MTLSAFWVLTPNVQPNGQTIIFALAYSFLLELDSTEITLYPCNTVTISWVSYVLSQKRILNYTKYEMLNKALEAFGDLGEDEELGPADWPTVRRYITSLDEVDGERMHPYSSAENNENLDNMNLKDIRVRFLNGKQSMPYVLISSIYSNRLLQLNIIFF